MSKEVKKFPRTFNSSSAAYRAIRHFEKDGKSSGLVMTKIDSKNFLVALPVKMTIDEFNDKHPNVVYPDATYRFFPDGVKNFGYYELKTGDRRRPNSKFIPLTKVYVDVVADVCLL